MISFQSTNSTKVSLLESMFVQFRIHSFDNLYLLSIQTPLLTRRASLMTKTWKVKSRVHRLLLS